MYAANTILTLKDQRPNDPETNEPFPYNVVKVVGPSPIDHGIREDSPWRGADAKGVIITPETNFGSTLDEPFGKLRQLYDVTTVPVVEAPVTPVIRVIDSATAEAGPTPEEVFAEQAPGTPPEEGQRRGRTSPLGDAPERAAVEEAEGPLGSVTPPEAPAAPPAPTSPLD